MNGKDAIIDKIRQDALQKANSTREEGSKKAQEAIAIAYNDAKIYKEKNLTESYAERDEIIARKITVANLESKKLLLKAKKDIIDKAFEEAVAAVKSDRDRYLGLIDRMVKFAVDGDVIMISAKDKDIVTVDYIAGCAKKYGKSITVSHDYGDFVGGLLIKGKGADKNLTLEAELAEVRREYEPAIAEVLFGE